MSLIEALAALYPAFERYRVHFSDPDKFKELHIVLTDIEKRRHLLSEKGLHYLRVLSLNTSDVLVGFLKDTLDDNNVSLPEVARIVDNDPILMASTGTLPTSKTGLGISNCCLSF